MPQAAKHRSTQRSLSGAAVISSRPKARHHGRNAGYAARQRPGSHSGEKTWREVADRGLEIVICIGHIVGVVMLVVDHLL
ncbi:MAG: hypothetical protein LGL72_17900 [Acidibrevibacterium sp.]|jgi:hypothetical protein|uniref:hypothetical protein n=1 Tax=Acidibrevibacterium fodinaquatile TaxID=1969806 RepID=UPI0023A90939|nr:hypothetical protein [Acidibrevibacterium fodinaquatile]MCA7121219.1 hypothetical protein [Acidibrevibacterium fodinaquatile]